MKHIATLSLLNRFFLSGVVALLAIFSVITIASATLFAQSKPRPKPKIDPLVLGLRDALYADAVLEELVDQLEILPAVQKPIALVRQGKTKAALAALDQFKNRDAFVPAIVRVFAHTESGKRKRAIANLKKLSTAEDSRIRLQSFRLLRELGVKPGGKHSRLALGAIVEHGSAGKSLVIAGYRDGSARAYYRAGKTIRDRGRPAVQAAAHKFTTALGQRIDTLKTEKNRNLPATGQVRFVLLTPGGVLVSRVSSRDLANPRHPLAASYAASLALEKAISLK